MKIESLGHSIPTQEITNDYFVTSLNLETSDQWITERTGIKKRYFTDDQTGSADLGYLAAKDCLKSSQLSQKDIDLIIVATSTPDHLAFPSTACLIQEKLGCKTTPAFDISAACSGFCYGLSISEGLLQLPHYKTILLIGVDCLSKISNMKDRTTCILFADGAGAALLTKSPASTRVLYSKIFADGSLNSILTIPKGGSKAPISQAIIDSNEHYIQMEGQSVFKTAINTIIPAIKNALKESSLDPSDISYLICHQANQRIINHIAKALKLSNKQVISNVEHYGNTSAASIPIAMSEFHKTTGFKQGDIIILAGFGAGFTWGITLIEWE